MSIEIMSKCWKYPMQSHTQKLVLIALADNANDSGVCWPSIATIAKKCDLSDRAVTDQISALESLGMLKVDEGGGRLSNRYTLLPGNPTEPPKRIKLTTPERRSPVNRVHPTPEPHSGAPLNGVHPTPEQGSNDPSIEPSVQPSLFALSAKSKKPSIEEAQLYGAKIGVSKSDVVAFLDHHEARGWKFKAGQPVVSWQAAMRTWKNNGVKWKTGNGVPISTNWDKLEREIDRL